MSQDVRWKQRFDNFAKSFALLESAVEIKEPTEVERAGMLQFYETTVELAWKTLKDYLLLQQFQVASPRSTIRQAFQSELITDGEVWLKALDDRNLIAHVYDEKIINLIEQRIRADYFQVLQQFHQDFQKKYAQE